MTLQQLQYFLATLEHGSFTEAAQALHLAQPSLSEQIRRLEGELGVKLFARVGRGIAPTEAARALRPHAEAALHAVHDARESVAAQRQLLGGIATFGTFGTARHFPGGAIIAEFRRRHPAVRVRMIGQNSAQVVEAVREGDLEAGLVALPIDDEGLEVRPIMRDEIVLCSTAAARLKRPVRAERLGEHPLILSEASYRLDDPTRRQLRERAQQAGVTLRADIEVEDVEIALELAADGAGDALASRGILHAMGRRLPRRLGWVPFDPPLYDTFALVSRRGATLSPASREFFALAEERLTAFAQTLKTRPPRKRAPQVTGS
jgi:DNA-binding transcriptional LysR family regulator